MIVENNFLKRSIYTQTGNFEYNISFSVDNTTGYANFGFSGLDKILDFEIISGKILDYENNFVYGLSPNEEVNISGRCNEDWQNFYINKKPIHFSGQKETHELEWVYVQAENCELDFDLYINGSRPDVAVSTIDFNNGNNSGSLLFTNNNTGQNVVLFSGDFYSGELFFSGLPISGLTGAREISVFQTNENDLSTTGSQYSGRYTLYTNFGNIEYFSSVIDKRDLELVLNLQGDTYINNTGTLTLRLDYEVLLGNIKVPILTGLNISFNHLSGLGEQSSGIITGKAETDTDKNILLSGVIYRTGSMTGDFSINATGYDKFINQNITGTATGRAIIEKLFVTGNFNERVSIPFTGLGSGVLLSGMIGSGNYNIPTLASGFVNASGAISSTPFLITGTGFRSGEINVIGEIPSGILTKNVFQTGILSGTLNLEVTGLATGTILQPIAMAATGRGFFDAQVTGFALVSGLVTGFGTGYWGVSGIINQFTGPIITTGSFFTGVTGIAVKKTQTTFTGIHTGSYVELVGHIWSNKDGITGGIIESGLTFTNSTMTLDDSLFLTGSGFFEGFFTRFVSSDNAYNDYMLRSQYRTGFYSGFSGFWTGYWEDTFSGYGVGNITGEHYTGLGLTWISGITTGIAFDGGGFNFVEGTWLNNTGVIQYQANPSSFIRLSGLSGADIDHPELGSWTGNAYKISGNTGVILATNYHMPRITGNFPPSLNLSYRDKAVWFEYDCIGGGTNASVTFGLDRYKKFRDNGEIIDIHHGQRSPGHGIYVYKTGVAGNLEFQNSSLTSSDGTFQKDYASNLNTGDKLYVLFALYVNDEDYDGIFQLAWRDGVRGASANSTYHLDNLEKQINYILPHEEGYIATDNFDNYDWDSSNPTGFLPSFLRKKDWKEFDFVSGEFSSVNPAVSGVAFVDITGNVLNKNGELEVEDFRTINSKLGFLGTGHKIFSLTDVSGYQFDSVSWSTLDSFPHFSIRIDTGDVQYNRGDTNHFHDLSNTLYNGVDYGDIDTFLTAANGEWNSRHIKFSKNPLGTTVFMTGYFPAWSSKLNFSFSASNNSFSEVANNSIRQRQTFPLSNDTLWTGRYSTTLKATGNFTGLVDISFTNLLVTGATGYNFITGNTEIYFEQTIKDGSGFYLFDTFVTTGTPAVFSGFAPYSTGAYVPVSNFSGLNKRIVNKTGYLEREISGLVTGILSYPTGLIKYSGHLSTEPKIFTINDLSGYFVFTGLQTGLASGYSMFFTGKNFISGTGAEFLENVNYNYIPQPFLFFRNYSGDLTGFFYSQNYIKTFTGEWGFRTGTLKGTSVINFSEGLYFSGTTGYSNHTQNHMISGSTGISIYVDRLKNLGTDVGQLVISGGGNIINLNITGGILPSGT